MDGQRESDAIANSAATSDASRGYYLDLASLHDLGSSRTYSGLWLYRNSNGTVRMVGNRACPAMVRSTTRRQITGVGPVELRNLPADQCHISDPVLMALGEVLIPALEEGFERPLVRRVLRLMNVHLSSGTEASAAAPEPMRRGLAPWQERRAKEFLMANFADNVAITDVAAICKLSRSHFIRAFKVSTTRTPHEWLLRYRVQRAQEWLLGSSSIAEIAVRCGFADQSHFTTVFKKFTGSAPGKYRRQNRI